MEILVPGVVLKVRHSSASFDRGVNLMILHLFVGRSLCCTFCGAGSKLSFYKHCESLSEPPIYGGTRNILVRRGELHC
jgi:hypothetical protein